MTREEATRRLHEYLSRPSSLRAICRVAGKEERYRRIQKALHRWRDGEGQGVSVEDAEWIVETLDKIEDQS